MAGLKKATTYSNANPPPGDFVRSWEPSAKRGNYCFKLRSPPPSQMKWSRAAIRKTRGKQEAKTTSRRKVPEEQSCKTKEKPFRALESPEILEQILTFAVIDIRKPLDICLLSELDMSQGFVMPTANARNKTEIDAAKILSSYLATTQLCNLKLVCRFWSEVIHSSPTFRKMQQAPQKRTGKKRNREDISGATEDLTLTVKPLTLAWADRLDYIYNPAANGGPGPPRDVVHCFQFDVQTIYSEDDLARSGYDVRYMTAIRPNVPRLSSQTVDTQEIQEIKNDLLAAETTLRSDTKRYFLVRKPRWVKVEELSSHIGLAFYTQGTNMEKFLYAPWHSVSTYPVQPCEKVRGCACAGYAMSQSYR